MPISRKEVEEIRNRENQIYWKISRFLGENKGIYYTVQEVVERLGFTVSEVEKQLEALHRNSPFYKIEGGFEAIDKLEHNGQIFYAKV